MRKNKVSHLFGKPYRRPVTEVFNMDLWPLAAGSPLYVLGGWVADPEDNNPWESTSVEIEGTIEEPDEAGGSSLGGWVISNDSPWEE